MIRRWSIMNFESTPLRIAALFLYLSISFFMYHGPRWLVPGRGWCRQVRLVARGQDSHATGRSWQSYTNIMNINFFSKYKLYIYILMIYTYYNIIISFYTNIINIIVTVTWHSWSARRRLAIWPSWVASHPPRSRHSRAAVVPCPIWFVLLKFPSGGPDNSTCHPALDVETQSRWQRECRLPHWGCVAWVSQLPCFQRSFFQKALVPLYWMLLFFNNCFQHHFSSFCSSPSLSLFFVI